MAERKRDRSRKVKPKRRFIKGWMKEWPFLIFVTTVTIVAIVLVWNFYGNIEDGDGNNNNGNGQTVPPRAIITLEKDNLFENDTITLDGSRSWGNIEQYLWDFGDGSEGNGPTVTHTYRKFGKLVIRLTVIDNKGDGHTDTAYIHVHHYEEQTGTLSVTQSKEYIIPVGNKCMGADLTLSFPTGSVIGGVPSNDLDIELFRPNGSLYLSSDDQSPDNGQYQLEELNIPTQEMAASFYQDWKVKVSSDAGINVKYVLEIEVHY